MGTHCVKVLTSYVASLATVTKRSLGMFNSAHCSHELATKYCILGIIHGRKNSQILWILE